MANEDYDDRRHLSRDVRDAHVAASAAKTLATLALIIAAIALTVAVMALFLMPANKRLLE